ncbi:hypothetical protein MMC17_010274, partial [Xylographa soralifera]|nr:hypothetical protein [Xylographa soralifera]
YFEIEVKIAIKPAGRVPGYPPPSGAQQVKELLDRRIKLVEEAEKREIKDGEGDEVNPWLTRTGWATYLKDQDRQKLLASVREPDEAKDPILATIWKAMDVISYGLIKAGGGTDLDRNHIDIWMGRIVEFREKLLVLIHITGGQPARGPELLSIRHSNTVRGEYRNVFVEDGAVVTVTRYYKGYTLKEDVKIIYRYLPREVGELLVLYLWLVLPLQQRLELELGDQVTRSSHLWSANPDGKK